MNSVVARRNRPRPRTRAVLGVLIGLAIGSTALVACGGSAGAPTDSDVKSVPIPGGRIAFRRHLDAEQTRGAIFVMSPDGSGETQLTRPGSSTVDDEPDWSPDGKQVVFTRSTLRGIRESHRLFVMAADGSGIRALSPGFKPSNGDEFVDGFDDRGVFSPDGSRIAFIHVEGHVASGGEHGIVDGNQIESSSVMVMKADGSNRRVVTTGVPWQGDDVGVSWSPRGDQLVFARSNSAAGRPAGGRALFVVGLDGKGEHRITPWNLGAGGIPDWSPDGETIVFRAVKDEEAGVGDFYTVRPDGSNLHRITRLGNKTVSHKVGLSTDGAWIVFSTAPAGSDANDLYAAPLKGPAGSPPKRLTTSSLSESSPDWTSVR